MTGTPDSLDVQRTTWCSEEHERLWRPRMRSIGAAWFDLQWRSVAEGIRGAAFEGVSPENMPRVASRLVRHGLVALPVARVAAETEYAVTSRPPDGRGAFVYRVVMARPRDAAGFQASFEAKDDVGMGRLLGFPACCRRFFDRVWNREGKRDPTWSMALAHGSPEFRGHTKHLEISGLLEANVLWRWMGIRLVPHMPCRPDCVESARLGAAMLQLGEDLGYAREMEWVREILGWPLQWTALHGRLEIETPILWFTSRTDMTEDKRVVSYTCGGRFSATGDAPLRAVGAEAGPGVQAGSPGPRDASENGFSSVEAMERAHRPIVDLVDRVLEGEAEPRILDLGCGNGLLLSRIAERRPGATCHGVEADPDRHAGTRRFFPGEAPNFFLGDMFSDGRVWNSEGMYTLALLMPGRLTEADQARSRALVRRLRERCKYVVVYAYGDWLTRFGGLAELCERAGLPACRDLDPSGTVGIVSFTPEPSGSPAT